MQEDKIALFGETGAAESIVLIPSYREVHRNLAALLTSLRIPHLVLYGMADIYRVRGRLLRAAITHTKARRFLWLDADVVPSAALLRAGMNLDDPNDIVAGCYADVQGRICGQLSATCGLDGCPGHDEGQNYPEHGRHDLFWAGFGFVSMSRLAAETVFAASGIIGHESLAFDRLLARRLPDIPNEAPATITEDTTGLCLGMPWNRDEGWLGEDTSFFCRAHACGITPVIDCDWQAFHMKEIAIPARIGAGVANLRP